MTCCTTTTATVLGMSVNDFNENKDLEVMTFRRNAMMLCQSVIEDRLNRGDEGSALYIYPPDIHSTSDLPQNIADRVAANPGGFIFIGVSVVATQQDSTKITVKVRPDALPEDVVTEVVQRRVITLNMSAEQRQTCVKQHQRSYILKVCGCEEFLLGSYPISQYKVN